MKRNRISRIRRAIYTDGNIEPQQPDVHMTQATNMALCSLSAGVLNANITVRYYGHFARTSANINGNCNFPSKCTCGKRREDHELLVDPAILALAHYSAGSPFDVRARAWAGVKYYHTANILWTETTRARVRARGVVRGRGPPRQTEIKSIIRAQSLYK